MTIAGGTAKTVDVENRNRKSTPMNINHAGGGRARAAHTAPMTEASAL
jgi:hypothetical protein